MYNFVFVIIFTSNVTDREILFFRQSSFLFLKIKAFIIILSSNLFENMLQRLHMTRDTIYFCTDQGPRYTLCIITIINILRFTLFESTLLKSTSVPVIQKGKHGWNFLESCFFSPNAFFYKGNPPHSFTELLHKDNETKTTTVGVHFLLLSEGTLL